MGTKQNNTTFSQTTIKQHIKSFDNTIIVTVYLLYHIVNATMIL